MMPDKKPSKKHKTSPTQRSLAFLRSAGYIVAIVEHFNPWVKIRQDLYGFADLIAFKPDGFGVVLVQTTVDGSVNARLKKIQENGAAAEWVKSEYRSVVVHGWGKRSEQRGGRKCWSLRSVWLDKNLQPIPDAIS